MKTMSFLPPARAVAGCLLGAFGLSIAAGLHAQTQKPSPTPPAASTAPQKPGTNPVGNGSPGAPPAGIATTPDYVIGPDDILAIIVWREKDMSGEVAVRPDGKITLPLVNEVQAAGLTPEQLRVSLTEAIGKLFEEPSVTVTVKAINSRKVFVTGQVGKPGPYPLIGPTNVMQLLAMAGGVLEYADAENISILRNENGKPVRLRLNYKDVSRGRNLSQNIELKPGDTVVVP
jgi:polysaccharide export outer membrane protein